MRKLLLTAVLAGTTLLAPALTTPAQASHDWFAIGTAFRIGAAHVSFVFGQPFYEYQPAYYYRYNQPIRYRGHSCNRYCFHDAGYYYHHESCPLVAAHFSHYRVDPYQTFSRYAPRYDGYRRDYRGDYGYDGRYDRYDRDGYDRYGRSDRYDRYDRSDRYDRYERRYDRSDRYRRYDRDDRYDGRRDRRGRGRGHRHHSGCDHD